MEKHKIQELVDRFNAGTATAAEARDLEQLIESGHVDLEELKDLRKLEEQVLKMENPLPSSDLDDRFYHMLAIEKGSKSSFSWKQFFSWPEFAPKLAFASVTMLIGLAAGYFLKPSVSQSDGQQMQALSQQVTDLKEMMMLSLLEKESATDRLRAVSLTEEIGEASTKVTTALLRTLNHDDNVNVRLAALDALRPYAKQSHVREELIRSIAMQESPLVQIALAELMEALQEKSSVTELEKILKSEKTPSDVKKKIKSSIQVLS